VPGIAFELGEPMSAETAVRCAAAARLLDRLLERADPAAWREWLSPGCQPVEGCEPEPPPRKPPGPLAPPAVRR
jgi:hypothetical protein